MLIREIRCKSLLNRSQLADYCINCFVGCSHACVYCYADSITRRFSAHTEPWGQFVDVKVNAPQVLIKEVLRKKKGSVFISSLTDPYQPLEKKYELTRKCIEILLRSGFSIWLQTKSSLVTRDIDILRKFKERCEVAFTITTLDEDIRKKFEPFSSPVGEKVEALERLRDSGIKTSVFFGPVLPFLSDRDLENFVKAIAQLKVSCLWVDKLNLKPGVLEKLEKVLRESYPELLGKWRQVLLFRGNYYTELKKRIAKLCKENEIAFNFCY